MRSQVSMTECAKPPHSVTDERTVLGWASRVRYAGLQKRSPLLTPNSKRPTTRITHSNFNRGFFVKAT